MSPDNHLVYRDAGFEGDGLTERMVNAAAAHLAEGGYATLLGSWLATTRNRPTSGHSPGPRDLGCDRWLLSFRLVDPLDHAATWNGPLAGDAVSIRPRSTAGSRTSTASTLPSSAKARFCCTGARRRATRQRVDEVDEDAVDDAADQVERAFATRERLECSASPPTCSTRGSRSRCRSASSGRSSRSAPVIVVNDATIALREGTCDVLEAPPAVLDVIAALDGETTLGRVVEKTASRLRLGERDTVRLRRGTVRLARELLELGALRFSDR